MKEFFNKISNSLSTQPLGYSARKLSALAIMVCVIAAHVAWIKRAFMENNFSMLESILVVDYGFIAGLLGMTTYQSLQEKKIDNKNKTENENNENKID